MQPLVQKEERFEQVQSHSSHLTFLYDINGLVDRKTESALQYCKHLETVLIFNISSESDTFKLYEELKLLNRVVTTETGPQDVPKLIYERHVEEIYPDTVAALRILLTIPVTGQRQEELRINEADKNHLRSTIIEERLNGLSVLLIGYKLAQSKCG